MSYFSILFSSPFLLLIGLFFCWYLFSDINTVQSPEIHSLTHDLDKSPNPLSLNPETCLEHDRALCCVPAYNSQLHATQKEICMEQSNVKQPEGLNCDQHVNGSTKVNSDSETRVLNESRSTKLKEARHQQKRKPSMKINDCKVMTRANGSGSLKKSAGVRGQGRNKGQGRSNSCAEIPIITSENQVHYFLMRKPVAFSSRNPFKI